jgi:hypothetical protein
MRITGAYISRINTILLIESMLANFAAIGKDRLSKGQQEL